MTCSCHRRSLGSRDAAKVHWKITLSSLKSCQIKIPIFLVSSKHLTYQTWTHPCLMILRHSEDDFCPPSPPQMVNDSMILPWVFIISYSSLQSIASCYALIQGQHFGQKASNRLKLPFQQFQNQGYLPYKWICNIVHTYLACCFGNLMKINVIVSNSMLHSAGKTSHSCISQALRVHHGRMFIYDALQSSQNATLALPVSRRRIPQSSWPLQT